MKISIIIPYYNDTENISKSVSSVLKQSYKNYEILIIDNELSKQSKKILRQIKSKSKKIKILTNNFQKGPGLTRNIGIKKAVGKFCAFLDSDDAWHRNKLQFQLKFMNQKNADISFTSYIGVKKNKKIYEVLAPNFLDYNNLLQACPICCSSIMIKSEIIKKNLFKNYLTKEDYELWLRLSKKIRFFGIKNKLTYYNVRNKSLSSMHLNKLTNAFKIYRNLNFSYIMSVIFIIRLYYGAFKKKYL